MPDQKVSDTLGRLTPCWRNTEGLLYPWRPALHEDLDAVVAGSFHPAQTRSLRISCHAKRCVFRSPSYSWKSQECPTFRGRRKTVSRIFRGTKLYSSDVLYIGYDRRPDHHNSVENQYARKAQGRRKKGESYDAVINRLLDERARGYPSPA